MSGLGADLKPSRMPAGQKSWLLSMKASGGPAGAWMSSRAAETTAADGRGGLLVDGHALSEVVASFGSLLTGEVQGPLG